MLRLSARDGPGTVGATPAGMRRHDVLGKHREAIRSAAARHNARSIALWGPSPTTKGAPDPPFNPSPKMSTKAGQLHFGHNTVELIEQGGDPFLCNHNFRSRSAGCRRQREWWLRPPLKSNVCSLSMM